MVFIKKIIIVLILAIFAAFILSGAATATDMISKDNTGTNSNGESSSTEQSVSSDGRYVTFESSATDLVENDANGATHDIFLRDTVTKKTQRVNYKKDGTQPDADCYSPVISGNGRYIAYSSYGNLGFNTLAGTRQVYLYDRYTLNTELVSKNSKQEAGTDSSDHPSISADGRYIVFSSNANNLWDTNYEATGSDSNSESDIFLRDRQTGVTKRISLSPTGIEGNDASYAPSISADGRYVVFMSLATNLVGGTDVGGDADVFIRDLWAGTTKRIMGLSNQEPNGKISDPFINANGQYVTFSSNANNLVANDNNGHVDVFLANTFTPGNPIVTLISLSSSGLQGNHDSLSSTISSDGRYITFASYATNLVSGDTNGFTDVFIRDRITGVTKRLSVNTNGNHANGNSYVDELAPCVSGNGRYVVFTSVASNLISGDATNRDVFINTVDFVGPAVKSISPKNGAKKVKRSNNIYIYFNENIRIASSSKIILKNSKGQTITTAKSVSGTRLTLNPTIRLAKYTKYYITILTGAISDFANNVNYNTRKYVFQFTTGRY